MIPGKPLDRAISNINYRLGKYCVGMGLTPSSHVSVRKILQTPPPYSYVRFHLVFQRNEMLEKDQLH